MDDNVPSLFSTRDLINLIFPLVCEQLLLMLVGMADTFVVSYVSEAAVSGVSLVNSFNTVFIYLFTALASGGAVIISQYIGHNDDAKAGESSSQLLMISFLFSTVIAVLSIIFCKPTDRNCHFGFFAVSGQNSVFPPNYDCFRTPNN